MNSPVYGRSINGRKSFDLRSWLTAVAQSQGNPFNDFNKGAYARVKNVLLRSAEKLHEEDTTSRRRTRCAAGVRL